jgi:hypothetical protein
MLILNGFLAQIAERERLQRSALRQQQRVAGVKARDRLIVPGWDRPIMAFAIAFPDSDKAISVEYEVNYLYWLQEYGPSE